MREGSRGRIQLQSVLAQFGDGSGGRKFRGTKRDYHRDMV